MSKLKVNTIEPASGGSVTVTGLALDGTGILSGSASGDAQGQIKINDVNVDINSLGTSNAPQFANIELGHASDTTLARSSAGVVTIEGEEVRTGTVGVTKGGTGATSLTDGGVLLGSGTGAVTAMAVLADGEMIVGDGTTDPVAESGATLRTSIGVGTGDSPQFTGLNLGHASDTTLTRASAGVLAVEGVNVLLAAGNAVVSSSAEGDAQGQIKFNGVNVNSNALGTDDTPQFASINLGHASDTTITRVSSGVAAIEGNNILTATGNAIVSASAEGDAQGQIKINGVNVNTNDLGTGDSPTFADLTLSGNLTVNGTTTTLNTSTLDVEDLNITVAKNAADSAAADGAGLTVDGASATFTYSHSGTKWNMNKALDMGSNTITTTGAIAGATLNTGQGANELYAMDQAVQTTNDVQFDSFGVGTAASGTTGEIRATNDITAFYSSDERLKENIVPLTGALDKVKALRGVSFDWKELNEEEKSTVHSHEGHDIGVIAQEIQAQYPELVTERENGYLAVDYVKLTAVLLQSIKELDAKVEACMAKK